MRVEIGKQVRGALTASLIAAAGLVSEPIVFQGFDETLAARPEKSPQPKRPEKVADKVWQAHEMTSFLHKMRSPESLRVLAEGTDKEVVHLLAEQPLVKRMRDPMLSNAELGRFYPRERPMVDPQFPKSNVEGVQDASMTFVPIRYRTKSGEQIRRGGTRVGEEAVLLTYRTIAERTGKPLTGSVFEQGLNAGVVQEVFGDGYQRAPILPMRFTKNANVHLSYGAIVGAPKDDSAQKARLEGDAGTLIDLAQAQALRRYLVAGIQSGQNTDAEKSKKLDYFLQKSLFLVSAGAEDEDTDETVRRFQDGSDGWQVFSAEKGVADKGDTKFSFAGILTFTVRVLDQNKRPRLAGYVVAGPEAIQEALAEYARKRGNKR